MKVLMFGWEYPPHIAGGLGTACEGLTRGLARQHVEVLFVMPHVMGDEDAPHMAISDPQKLISEQRLLGTLADAPEAGLDASDEAMIRRYGIPAYLMPYWTNEDYLEHVAAEAPGGLRVSEGAVASRGTVTGVAQPAETTAQAIRQQYGSDIFEEVANFTMRALHATQALDFDVIHAHDWMTFALGVALKHKTGKPLVVHVHSLEYDRSGAYANERINDLEGYGVTQADAVIAVSHYTKQVIHRIHSVPEDRIHVVHNGIYPKQAIRHYQSKHPEWPRHVVLFLGRVTFQKGPDYFVRAAAKVIPHVPNVLFVLAGAGDMLNQVQQLAKELGVEEHFLFPGFLRGKAVEEMFSVADLYVMPSVSEPFGISALEAINFEVPALISRQSGVSEVVDHSLKFDFWDVDRLADLIINGLVHEELRADMIESARRELNKLRWDASATKAVEVYQQLLN